MKFKLILLFFISSLSLYSQVGSININVFDRALLEKAMQEPENYPQLTIRVSGYAVNFVKLSKAHQKEVIKRTFYQAV